MTDLFNIFFATIKEMTTKMRTTAATITNEPEIF